jgi:hypothetical protein
MKSKKSISFWGLKVKITNIQLNKMLKMTCSSKYHCKFIFVAIIYAQFVFIDPPGWIQLLSCVFCNFTSGKGKSVTLAIRLRLNQIQIFAFQLLIKASTLEVCPVPKYKVPFFKNNSDFVFLQILRANIKSWIPSSVGLVMVTVLYCL